VGMAYRRNSSFLVTMKAVFTNLMNASEQKHLKAFERCN